jgi:hypothetical protein
MSFWKRNERLGYPVESETDETTPFRAKFDIHIYI